MSLKQIRVNEYTVKELREKGKDFGQPTDDVIIRLTLAENDKLIVENKYVKTENELLKKKLAECEKKEE